MQSQREPFSPDREKTCSSAPHGDRSGALARIDSVRAPLYEVGWDAPERQQPAEIDLGVLKPLLRNMMENDVETPRYLADRGNVSQRERARAGSRDRTIPHRARRRGDDDGQASRARQ